VIRLQKNCQKNRTLSGRRSEKKRRQVDETNGESWRDFTTQLSNKARFTGHPRCQPHASPHHRQGKTASIGGRGVCTIPLLGGKEVLLSAVPARKERGTRETPAKTSPQKSDSKEGQGILYHKRGTGPRRTRGPSVLPNWTEERGEERNVEYWKRGKISKAPATPALPRQSYQS